MNINHSRKRQWSAPKSQVDTGCVRLTSQRPPADPRHFRIRQRTRRRSTSSHSCRRRELHHRRVTAEEAMSAVMCLTCEVLQVTIGSIGPTGYGMVNSPQLGSVVHAPRASGLASSIIRMNPIPKFQRHQGTQLERSHASSERHDLESRLSRLPRSSRS